MDSTKGGVRNLEIAARNVDKAIFNDCSAPTLLEVMNVNAQTGPTSSGTTDNDYPNLARLPLSLNNIVQLKTLRKVPLPTEIIERINHIQCHSMMGLFTEIDRAWLTVDSDIYMWTYEEGGDVAYYDGINETILCVGLIKPRPDVFRPFIKYLLILTTATDISVLAVSFSRGGTDSLDEIQLVPDPVFTLPTDGSIITAIVGTSAGRIFLGSKEGDLYEISYQAESSWFGKRCKKLNHSTSALSYLMPSFVTAALTEEDPIAQISIDNSRHILYMLTDKGCIWVYDLGETGNSLSKVTKLTQASLVQQAMNTVKTLDSQNFRPIVGISAIENFESPHINLVAVSQTGVRFYLSVVGLSNLQPNQRPYTLTLLHVRLPPGYSAVLTTRPRMVHISSYRESNLMLLSTVNDRDTLWCINSDMFPFSSTFMESYTTEALDGLALAMGEVHHEGSILRNKPFQQLPSLAVRQHFEPPRKFVVLTAQGAHIFIKLRPVDVLRQLLVDCRGADNATIKAFFAIQKDEQACATSLILACSESINNVDVSDWATRAFFLYGGEPKVAVAPNVGLNQSNLHSGSPSFMPNYMSTPMPAHARQTQFLQSPTTQIMDQQHSNAFSGSYSPYIYSAKHNGLYLYLGRIVRPIWNIYCTEKLENSPAGKTYLASMISADECAWILSYLNTLWSFLQKNTLLSVCTSLNESVALQTTLANNTTRLNQSVQDAQLEERRSLESFKHLVYSCCQVVGLWKILCEHQFHILAETLPVDYQQALLNISFKELILSGQEITIAFVNTLIASYLSNDALIDTISTKLREVCPDLYKNEDAACSKAFEMLKLAKVVQNMNEKEDLISSALQLCKSAAPNINLHEICQQFISLSAYHALVDLCVTCAKKTDPDNLAEYYYKQTTDGNQDAYNYYTKRMFVYKEILLALDYLKSQSYIMEDQRTGRPQDPTTLLKEGDDLILHVVLDILQYPDELLHVAVYEWMMSKGMETDIIKSAQPSLEKYLIKASQQSQENIPALDLLWKYYESTNNHLYAAKILHNLSSLNGNMLTLKQRAAYLSRAIMCMRSHNVGYAANHGVVLRDMEEKMDIIKVQELILDTISADYASHPNAEEAITVLNSGLYDLTQLYEQFADAFNLWECKLAILECAGHTDPDLIQNIWHQIIKEEIKKKSGSADDRLGQLLMKIVFLIRQYKESQNTMVPLLYLVEQLEVLSINLKASVHIVPSSFSSEVPMEKLIAVYNTLICSKQKNNAYWTVEENEFHLAESFVELVNKFLSRENLFDHQTRMKIKAFAEDAVAKMLTRVYGKPNTEHLIGVLRGVQHRLSKI